MKQSEVRELSVAELQEEFAKSKKAYSDLKMAHAVSPCLLYTSDAADE